MTTKFVLWMEWKFKNITPIHNKKPEWTIYLKTYFHKKVVKSQFVSNLFPDHCNRIFLILKFEFDLLVNQVLNKSVRCDASIETHNISTVM